jgi:hypothetical protein
MTLFPADELNALESKIEAVKSPDRAKKKEEVDKYIDEVTDLFVTAYVFGTIEVSQQLGQAIEPDISEMRSVIEERFDGKNYRDRLNEYLESGTEYDVRRVLETDAHRVYNAALFTGAKKAGATQKTWNCMMLPTSRDSHVYLDGVTIPIDAEFYSINGGKTLYPGQWGIAEEDCNCLCTLTFSKL